MSFDLVHIWSSMGLLSKLIAGILCLMGVASLAVFIERSWTLAKSAASSRAFARAVAPQLEDGDLRAVIATCDGHRASSLARLFGAIVDRYLRALERGDDTTEAVDKARAEAERRKEVVSTELRSGVAIVATVGSIAPFVGLLGTVVGIIGAFQGIAATGSGGLGSVSVGIAEALVETALGLMIAIPAVIVFNVLTQRIGKVEQAVGRSVGELLEDLGRVRLGERSSFDDTDETRVVDRPAAGKPVAAQPAATLAA